MAGSTCRKRPLCDYFDQIAVKVGPDEKVTMVNPSILTANSEFFRKALSDNWRRGHANVSNFKAIDVNTFNVYLNWCTHGDLDVIIESLSSGSSDASERSELDFHLLAVIFSLADVLDDKLLRNTGMDKSLELAESSGDSPGVETIKFAFSNLPESSSMCRFIIDNALAGTSASWLGEHLDTLPKDFTDALLFGWAASSIDKTIKYVKPTALVKNAPCLYHEHDDEVLPGEHCMSATTAAKQTPTKSGQKAKKRPKMLDLW